MWWRVSTILLLVVLPLSLYGEEFTVSTGVDSVEGSLRWAMSEASANPGPHKIVFNIPTTDTSYIDSASVWVIRPESALPKLIAGLTEIDGRSQTIAQGDSNLTGPEIMIDGSLIEGTAKGLEIKSSGNWIHDIAIGNFSHNQIAIIGEDADNNKISGCYVGITADGSQALNGVASVNGILITAGADANVIGGNSAAERNVVGGMTFHGIVIFGQGCSNNIISGNYVGTDYTGTSAIPNKKDGIRLELGAVKNRVGGSTPFQRNLCSGNGRSGIRIEGVGADSNVVIGNWIGINAEGTTALPNNSGGIVVLKGASANRIGGLNRADGNIISANKSNGLQIQGESYFNIVIGNTIGLAADSAIVLGNESNGIMIGYGASNNKIGPANIICGNGNEGGGWANGVFLIGNKTKDNVLVDNYIGLLEDETAIGNIGHGISIQSGANSNRIGPGNIIANNGGDGVRIWQDSTFYNTITENSIFSNSGKGIETMDDGNMEITPPVVYFAKNGIVRGQAQSNVRIEIFQGPDGQGKNLVGTTLSEENGIFELEAVEFDTLVTATVTDSLGNTSEFSVSIQSSVKRIASAGIVDNFSLEQNYPNPFNPSTTITFSLPTNEFVTLDIFNIRGQRVVRLVDEKLSAGKHQVVWDVRDVRDGKNAALPSGMYLYRLDAGSYYATKKLTVLK